MTASARNDFQDAPVAEARAHVEALHRLANNVEGLLVVSTFHASTTGDEDRPGTVTHHQVGDVDGMVEAIEAHRDSRGANVYVGLQIMRNGLARGRRGKESDIVAVLGLVADMDGDTGKVGDLPIEPNLTLETSPGNGQPFWLFDRPLTTAEAKPLAEALKRATGSDHGTADVAHVWRIPGTLNWPNRKKLERGRSPDPFGVTVAQKWDGSLTSVDQFMVALAPWMHATHESANFKFGEIPDAAQLNVSPGAADVLAASDVGDRSAHAARVAEKLAFDGHSAEEALALFLAATGNWIERYRDEAEMRVDFERLWAKFGQRHDHHGDSAARTDEEQPEAANNSEPANDNDAPVDVWAEFDRPHLPSGLLPPIIEEFSRVLGEQMGVDPGGLALSAITVCAAAIPDKIQLQVKRHSSGWMESARFWGIVVGDPSSKKTPMLSAAAAPIAAINNGLVRRYLEERSAYFALDKKIRETVPAPIQLRTVLDDTTIESASEVLRDNPEGVLLYQDELSGWFGSMEKYGGAKAAAADRSFWLKAFNGGPYISNRIIRGVTFVPNLSVSMLGGIQPEPIRAIAKNALDDGLLQRICPVVLGPAGVDKDEPTAPVATMYNALVGRLYRLQSPKGGLNKLEGIIDVPLCFDEGAQAIRNELAEKHREMLRGWEPISKKLASHIGKYDGIFARLCIIWHCVESTGNTPPSVIAAATARRVADFLHGYLFKHALAFYQSVLGLTDRQDALLSAAGWILTHKLKVVSVRDARRSGGPMRDLDVEQAQAVLDRLDAFGWLNALPSVRRDSQRWSVNAAVHTMFSERAAIEARRRADIRRTIAEASSGNQK